MVHLSGSASSHVEGLLWIWNGHFDAPSIQHHGRWDCPLFDAIDIIFIHFQQSSLPLEADPVHKLCSRSTIPKSLEGSPPNLDRLEPIHIFPSGFSSGVKEWNLNGYEGATEDSSHIGTNTNRWHFDHLRGYFWERGTKNQNLLADGQEKGVARVIQLGFSRARGWLGREES